MKEKILEIIEKHPKHYTQIIKRNSEMIEWVEKNSPATTNHLPTKIFCAVYQISNICPQGKEKTISRWSTGLTGCGPASICTCTKQSIAENVSNSKQKYTKKQKEEINKKREKTMLQTYGVKFNSQREEIKSQWTKPKISDINYKLLSDKNWLYKQYITNKRTLTDIADELGVYYGTVGDYCHQHGFDIRQRTNYSLIELEILNYIQSLGESAIHSDWNTLKNQEIDILIPDKNIGIEVNGLYWHSFNPASSLIENQQQHITKTLEAKKNGIRLIHITDYEWNNKKEIIQGILQSVLGHSKKIYARQCEYRTIDTKTARSFFEGNHLQGFAAGHTYIGLYYKNELMISLVLGKSRFDKSSENEIIRFATKCGHTVVGGLSKLLSNTNSSLTSYCDLDKYTGAGYQKCGFQKIKTTGPGYFWTDGTNIFSRYKCQKKNLEKWLPSFDKNLSESKNLFSAGYRRFWTCGNDIYYKQ